MKTFKRKYSQAFYKQLVSYVKTHTGIKNLELAYDVFMSSDALDYSFDVDETPGCCGVEQINAMNVQDEVKLMLSLAYMLDSVSLIKYYSVDPKYTASLKKFGFKVDRTFVNKNSGATITELSYDSVSQGDWWWPTLNDIYLALPALRPMPVQSTRMGRSTASPVKTISRRRT